jgi:ABC-type amino acid transport substrate-binding protein
MNFTIDLVASEQMFGHYYAESKNWSGVMGRLVSKEIDIGVAEFSRNKRRLEVVDFSVPLLISRFNMYLKQPNMTAIIWTSYLQVILSSTSIF